MDERTATRAQHRVSLAGKQPRTRDQAGYKVGFVEVGRVRDALVFFVCVCVGYILK